jgi:hypothetical protein
MKKLFYLIIVLVGLGMWLGINFAKNQPLFSNPFADREIAEKAKQTVKGVQRKAEEVVDRALDETSR